MPITCCCSATGRPARRRCELAGWAAIPRQASAWIIRRQHRSGSSGRRRSRTSPSRGRCRLARRPAGPCRRYPGTSSGADPADCRRCRLRRDRTQRASAGAPIGTWCQVIRGVSLHGECNASAFWFAVRSECLGPMRSWLKPAPHGDWDFDHRVLALRKSCDHLLPTFSAAGLVLPATASKEVTLSV